MYDVSFGERERKIHRDPTGNWTQDLPITRQTLLPLSHWTHSRGAKASLLITAMLEASADFSCLSLSHRWKHYRIFKWRSLADGVVGLGCSNGEREKDSWSRLRPLAWLLYADLLQHLCCGYSDSVHGKSVCLVIGRSQVRFPVGSPWGLFFLSLQSLHQVVLAYIEPLHQKLCTLPEIEKPTRILYVSSSVKSTSFLWVCNFKATSLSLLVCGHCREDLARGLMNSNWMLLPLTHWSSGVATEDKCRYP